MSNHSAGHKAEQYAAQHLKKQGYEIIDINWRTKYCEIDIIAKKQSVIYLVEVKYRSSESYGSGFEYITATKLKQMQFAAEIWASNNKWEGDYQLAAIELMGSNFSVKNFLPLV